MQIPLRFGLQSVGNKIIDSEHNKLIGMMDDIAQLIHLKHDVALSVSLKLLNDGMREYFAVEESIANAINFDFADHRRAHQKLLDEIKSITSRIMSENHKWSAMKRNDCIQSLNDCLIRHVKEDSKVFKALLETHSYDFKPG